jgi:hypothetical protein
MSDRLDDVDKVAGERGLVRGDDDGRARVNEGKAKARPPVDSGDVGTDIVEEYKGNAASPAIRTHAPYVDPVNSALHGPTRNAQVASTDANIGTVYGVGAADPRPPLSGDVEEYAGNAASPAIHTHGPYVDPVNAAASGPGNGTDNVTEPASDPRPPLSGDVEEYAGNAASPAIHTHYPYVDPVNDGSTEDTVTDASGDE